MESQDSEPGNPYPSLCLYEGTKYSGGCPGLVDLYFILFWIYQVQEWRDFPGKWPYRDHEIQ